MGWQCVYLINVWEQLEKIEIFIPKILIYRARTNSPANLKQTRFVPNFEAGHHRRRQL